MSNLKQKAQSILNEKDTKIKPENIKKNVQVFDVVGTLDGIDTSDATATSSDLVMDATAYVKGVKISGSIRDYRSESGISDFEDAEYSGDVPEDSKLKILTHMSSGASDTVISSDNNIEFLMPYSELTTNLGLTADKLKKGETILGVTGTLDSEGTDTSDATATENDLVADTTAYVNGVKITGKLFDNRTGSGYNEIDGTQVGDFTDDGYLYSGGYIKKLPSYLSGVVFSDEVLVGVKMPYSTITEEIGLTANKLKKGETILGVTGTLDSEGTDTSDATATAEDLIEGTTAYVNGEKIEGTLEVTDAISIDNSTNTDTSITLTDLGDIPSMVIDADITDFYGTKKAVEDGSTLEIIVSQAQIANDINLTANKIALGQTILGVTGTYSGSSIVYLEPGDEIHINMKGLKDALETLVYEGGFGSQSIAYDGDGEDLFTLKLMDCVNMGQPYNHSGIGLVMDGTTTYLKVYNWDATTDTNAVQFSAFINLVSGTYPDASNFTIDHLLSIMNELGGHEETDLTFVNPSNAPIIPLIQSNSVGLLTIEGCDIGDVLTFNLANSYVTIHKAC